MLVFNFLTMLIYGLSTLILVLVLLCVIKQMSDKNVMIKEIKVGIAGINIRFEFKNQKRAEEDRSPPYCKTQTKD